MTSRISLARLGLLFFFISSGCLIDNDRVGARTGGQVDTGRDDPDVENADPDVESADLDVESADPDVESADPDVENEPVRSMTWVERICHASSYSAPPFQGTEVDATLVQDGFKGAEGPVWIESENALFFSEMDRAGQMWALATGAAIQKYLPQEGRFEVWVAASGTNGLSLTLDGALLGAAQDVQDLSEFTLGNQNRVHFNLEFQGNKFNAPNDLTVRSDGTIYFTDPGWQLGNRQRNQEKDAVYRVDLDGTVTVVDDDFGRPNGLSLSPDESKLYVGSDRSSIGVYEVNTDGSTGSRTTFAVVDGAFTDGFAVDCAGNVYIASPEGVEVLDSLGKLIGKIRTKRNGTPCTASNAAFGGKDHRTLFMTVEGCNEKAIYAIELAIPGMPY